MGVLPLALIRGGCSEETPVEATYAGPSPLFSRGNVLTTTYMYLTGLHIARLVHGESSLAVAQVLVI